MSHVIQRLQAAGATKHARQFCYLPEDHPVMVALLAKWARREIRHPQRSIENATSAGRVPSGGPV